MRIQCLCCGKELTLIYPLVPSSPAISPENDCWYNSGVDLFIPNFGSRHDSEEIMIGICDECLDEKIKTRIAIVK